MRKIAKVSNAEKSKKLLEELLQRKAQLEAMEGVELFKQIVIQTQIDRIMVSLLKSDRQFAEFGLLGTSIDSVMDLNGFIKVSVKFISSILKFEGV